MSKSDTKAKDQKISNNKKSYLIITHQNTPSVTHIITPTKSNLSQNIKQQKTQKISHLNHINYKQQSNW